MYNSKQYQECNYRVINYCNKGNFERHGFQYDLEKGSEGAGNSVAGKVLWAWVGKKIEVKEVQGETSTWSKEHGEEALLSPES